MSAMGLCRVGHGSVPCRPWVCAVSAPVFPVRSKTLPETPCWRRVLRPRSPRVSLCLSVSQSPRVSLCLSVLQSLSEAACGAGCSYGSVLVSGLKCQVSWNLCHVSCAVCLMSSVEYCNTSSNVWLFCQPGGMG